MQNRVICLILGGGAGSRLYPLTAERSKPAVPIAGKYRLIDIPISNCLNSGITRMFVLTQFNSASLNRHIKHTYHFDAFSKGFVDIQAAEQTFRSREWFQGTADAVRQTLPRLDNWEFDYVMVLSGDQLYQMNFTEFLKTHAEKDAEITIATIPVVADHASGFGIMKVDSEGKISNFVEKPAPDVLPQWTSDVSEEYRSQGRHYLASMGIYLFNKDVLRNLLEKFPDEHDFGKGIIPRSIAENHRIVSHPFDGYWTDIGTIRSFFEATLSLSDPIPQFNLFDNERPVYTRARMLSPTKIFGTSCEKALIAEGCIIHAKELLRVVIGVRSRIGKDSVLRNVYAMGQDYYEDIKELLRLDKIPMGIGADCHIENAIIDRNACIGNNGKIVGSEKLEEQENEIYCIKDGIVVVRKGVKIPPGTRIGLTDE
ncbi:MAG: glucose-1-phosphate adenylyltransferase [Saprospiraceae bacterium]|nr:glucose-1-phosphate adenylyltransferase [Saprospiraceae bacterium]